MISASLRHPLLFKKKPVSSIRQYRLILPCSLAFFHPLPQSFVTPGHNELATLRIRSSISSLKSSKPIRSLCSAINATFSMATTSLPLSPLVACRAVSSLQEALEGVLRHAGCSRTHQRLTRSPFRQPAQPRGNAQASCSVSRILLIFFLFLHFSPPFTQDLICQYIHNLDCRDGILISLAWERVSEARSGRRAPHTSRRRQFFWPRKRDRRQRKRTKTRSAYVFVPPSHVPHGTREAVAETPNTERRLLQVGIRPCWFHTYMIQV